MDVIFLTNYHILCVCLYVCVRVWAVFWGMSPELCGGLAIHRPPLQNGQNHTTMRHGRGRIPGMLKYRARHSPLPLTENTNARLPSSPRPRPGQWRREQQLRGKGMSYRWWRGRAHGQMAFCSGHYSGKDFRQPATSST